MKLLQFPEFLIPGKNILLGFLLIRTVSLNVQTMRWEFPRHRFSSVLVKILWLHSSTEKLWAKSPSPTSVARLLACDFEPTLA